ncbi:MAG: polysaccharide biosynthesis protein [Firmicutes bacterium]|nr:polysaccharide biosynthesis protein [Bacillota bacterium]
MNRPVSVFKGTVLLAAAGLIVKIFGAAYRIVLARLIGAEGIGLFQMAYPIYLVFLSLSTAGIPIALSKLIAEKEIQKDYLGVKIIFKAALRLLLSLGILCSVSMGFSAGWLAEKVVADQRAIYVIWALTPATFFMSLLAVFRGYFQGKQRMEFSAVSQIIEQVVRVSVAIILAILLVKEGIEYAAAGAAFGATVGGAASLVYLALIYLGSSQKVKTKTDRQSIKLAIKRIVRFTLPISVAVVLMPVIQTLDTIIVPLRLQSIGYTVNQGTAMLGILGNSWAVLYLPTIVTAAIASNLVPAVASFKVIGKREGLSEKIENGIRLGLIWVLPMAVGLFWFGGSIFRILYGIRGIEILSWLAPAIIFLGLEQITAGILQGLGKPVQPLFNFGTGAVVKIIVSWLTIGWPGLNLAGAALGTVCGSMITAGLNWFSLRRLVTIKLNLLSPGLAGFVMLVVCRYLIKVLQLNYIWEMVLGGGLSFLVYLIVLRLLGGIKNSDLEVMGKFLRRRGTNHV